MSVGLQCSLPVIFYERCVKPKEKGAVIVVFGKILKKTWLKQKVSFIIKFIPRTNDSNEFKISSLIPVNAY